MAAGLRPRSAPDGGFIAVCPHCWEVNVGGERLCGRCGADMTLVLQESGGLRRTAPVQSPVPVRATGRLGMAARAGLALLTALLALAWLLAPLLGSAGARARIHRLSGSVGEWGSGGNYSSYTTRIHELSGSVGEWGSGRSDFLHTPTNGKRGGDWASGGNDFAGSPSPPLSPSVGGRAAPSPAR